MLEFLVNVLEGMSAHVYAGHVLLYQSAAEAYSTLALDNTCLFLSSPVLSLFAAIAMLSPTERLWTINPDIALKSMMVKFCCDLAYRAWQLEGTTRKSVTNSQSTLTPPITTSSTAVALTMTAHESSISLQPTPASALPHATAAYTDQMKASVRHGYLDIVF